MTGETIIDVLVKGACAVAINELSFAFFGHFMFTQYKTKLLTLNYCLL